MNQQHIIIASAALILIASASGARGSIEASDGDVVGMLSTDVLTDRMETTLNRLTETAANVDDNTAGANIAAFLRVIQQCEGTASAGDAYRVCYGYTHTIQDMRDHPVETGEWPGVVLSDTMCANAGFGPGCKSTAAGAYQIIRGTWRKLKADLGLVDFGYASQDAAAIELIRQRGALEDVKAGRLDQAVYKVRAVWASLPGNYAKQGQRSMDQIASWYQNEGGAIA